MPAGVDYAMGNKRNSKWPLAKHNELRKMRDENARLDDLLEQAKAERQALETDLKALREGNGKLRQDCDKEREDREKQIQEQEEEERLLATNLETRSRKLRALKRKVSSGSRKTEHYFPKVRIYCQCAKRIIAHHSTAHIQTEALLLKGGKQELEIIQPTHWQNLK